MHQNVVDSIPGQGACERQLIGASLSFSLTLSLSLSLPLSLLLSLKSIHISSGEDLKNCVGLFKNSRLQEDTNITSEYSCCISFPQESSFLETKTKQLDKTDEDRRQTKVVFYQHLPMCMLLAKADSNLLLKRDDYMIGSHSLSLRTLKNDLPDILKAHSCQVLAHFHGLISSFPVQLRVLQQIRTTVFCQMVIS